ncbi:MAG: sensor histidine kinase [Bacteroidaceae bacterium]|jgi:two-component system nitrogen regulation sensor histidine kinase NtrY
MTVRMSFGMRLAGNILLLLAAVYGIYFFAVREMWCSAVMCGVAFAGICWALYRMQVRQLRLLQRLVYKICEGDGVMGSDYLSLAGHSRVFREIGDELEFLFARFRKRQWEEAERLKFYEILLGQVETGVVVTTEEGHICWKNRAALRHLGACIRVSEAWLRLERTGEAVVVPALDAEKGGEWLLSVSQFTNEGRLQLLFALKDIRNVLEEKQNESWKKLITVLTHEIMNSIAPILSLSETLGTQPLSGQYDPKMQKRLHQAMQTIYRRSRGLLDFTQNYRKLTHIPAPQMGNVDASALFEDLAALFNDKHLSFDQPYPDFQFRADRSQMEQVLINLIKNAREAAAPEPVEIHVALRRSADGSVQISVRDRGPGMSPEVQKQVFVPFFTTKSGGSGIGLTLCMQIMLQHGGYIYLHSAPGRGSCFTLTLPGSGK